MRAFAIVVAVIFAALLLVAGAGWYWWRMHGESVVTASRTAFHDGRSRGASVDETVCLAEVRQRNQADRGGDVAGLLSRSIWLDGCLRSSHVAARFCEGVPRPQEFINSGNWVAAACGRQGVADPGCQSLYQQVAKYCSSPERTAKLASP
jgi:hypothetical protein